MAKDLTVILEARPGTLAEAFEALGRAGVNVDGAFGMEVDGQGVLHLLVEEVEPARRALEQAGSGVKEVKGEQDVLVTALEDTPGAAGSLLRRIADAGVDIKFAYLATNTRVVIGADNLAAARQQLQAGIGAPEAHT